MPLAIGSTQGWTEVRGRRRGRCEVRGADRSDIPRKEGQDMTEQPPATSRSAGGHVRPVQAPRSPRPAAAKMRNANDKEVR